MDVVILDSEEDIKKKYDGKTYDYYPKCSREGVKKFETTCTLGKNKVLLLETSLDFSSYVKITIFKRIPLKNVVLNYYKIDGDECVILEATAGKYGYPGYAGETQNKTKIAIDPYNHKSFRLR